MADENVTSRYNRDWLQLGDDRKVRGFDNQSAARRGVTYYASGATVSTTGDNVPA